MITIKKAKASEATVLALLGRLTYIESHGHFIEDKNDLSKYVERAFSVSKIKEDLSQSKNHFYMVYVDNLPVGYAKLVLNAAHECIDSTHSCMLERIYILDEFLPLKIGQPFLTFLEDQVKKLHIDTLWLTVYKKNDRAIRFYQKNEFKHVGEYNFLVNDKGYECLVFSKNYNNLRDHSPLNTSEGLTVMK